MTDYACTNNTRTLYVSISPGYKPEKIIINNKTTICYWPDGSKTVVTCSGDDQFSIEAGVAMCIAKKVYGNNRSAFLKNVATAYVQLPRKSKSDNG